MRKLAWGCSQAQMHHGLAVLAITEGAVSKKHINTEGFTRYPEVKLGTEELHTGSYSVLLVEEDKQVYVITKTDGCRVAWSFSYPTWKLLAFTLEACTCYAGALAEHDL